MRDSLPQINLTDTRDRFYSKLNEYIHFPNQGTGVVKFADSIKKKEVDVDIRCLTRDELPDLVRPKTQSRRIHVIPVPDPFGGNGTSMLGEKRTFA